FGDHGLTFGALALQDLADQRHVETGDGTVERVDEIVAQVGYDAAERIGDAGSRRHHDPRYAELSGKSGGMQRSRAAEGEEGKVARIVSFADRHYTHRAGHLDIGEPEHRSGRLDPVEPDAAAELFGKDGA